MTVTQNHLLVGDTLTQTALHD